MIKYELKDVLFGLRNEYKKMEEKTEKIKSIIASSEEDVDFIISHDENGISTLNIKFPDRFKLKPLNMIFKRPSFKTELTGQETALYCNDAIRIKNLNIEKTNLLYDLVDGLLSSKYILESPTKIAISESLGENIIGKKNVIFQPAGIVLSASETCDNLKAFYPSEYLSYSPCEDQISYTVYRETCAYPSIIKLLGTEIPCDKLSDYQKRIIKESGVMGKPLIVEPESYRITENNKFSVDINDESIVLTKKLK